MKSDILAEQIQILKTIIKEHKTDYIMNIIHNFKNMHHKWTQTHTKHIPILHSEYNFDYFLGENRNTIGIWIWEHP